MHGYILRTGARLAPFGDPVGDALILNRRLEDHQRAALKPHCASVEVIDSVDQIPKTSSSPLVLVEDHLYFTPHLLRKALRQARKTKTEAPARVALGDSVYIHEKATLGGLTLHEETGSLPDTPRRSIAPLPLVLWRGAPFDPSRLDSLAFLTIPVREKSFVPDNLQLLRDDLELRYAITRDGAISLRHWSHLLDASQLALASYWLDFSPLRILWLLWRVVTSLSLRPWSIAAHVNKIGRRCQIHPTAWIVGSVLGDNVQVGPYSVVFGSVLGDGARVESQSEIVLSSIGERAVVSFGTRVALSVLYPMSMASYPAMQMCVLGRRALHMGGCFPIDMKLTRGDLLDVKVKRNTAEGARIVESGKKFLGICVGHRSIVGTGLWIQSGVEVPSDYILVRDKADIVTRIPDGQEGKTLSLQDGELREYGAPTTSPNRSGVQS